MARSRVTIPFVLAVLAALVGGSLFLFTDVFEPEAAGPVGGAEPGAPVPMSLTTTPGLEKIRIASWNVLNLGEDTAVEERAEVIAQYDIVALQEIESFVGLDRLEAEVERISGVTWDVVKSPMVGEGSAAEAYAFIYRTDRVEEADGPKGVYPEASDTDFSREPFFATFRAGSFDFTIVTIHVTFGLPSERTAEVERLPQVWRHVQDADPVENDVLLMGDFNRDKPTHRAFNPLEALGAIPLISGDGVFTSYSTLADKIGANLYDGIWIDPAHTGSEYTSTSGVDYLHERYYQEAEHPHLEVRKELSDHCPVWAEFRCSDEDDD